MLKQKRKSSPIDTTEPVCTHCSTQHAQVGKWVTEMQLRRSIYHVGNGQRHSLVHWESREDLWGTITRPVALWITSRDPPLRQDLSIKALLIPLVSARMVSKCKELHTEKCCAIQAGFFLFFLSKRHLESGLIFLFVCSSLKSFP